ncbi:MAG TPA: hypothetical protein VHG91_20640 [Longimicrobium sp.]|nr:hypothetical protein [Longimicrobium sp.]
MDDDLEFDLTEEELRLALRLVLGEDDARRKASKIAGMLTPDMDWAASEEMLLALSLASESGDRKVRRLRAASGLDTDNASWDQKRERFRRELEEQGELPPG